jgi:hypothetical protein
MLGEDCTYKFMHCQQINLGKRIVNLKDFREVVDNLVTVVQRKATLFLQALCSVYTNGDVLAVVLALGESLDVLEVTNSPRQKVRRHNGCALEDNSVEAIALAGLDVFLWHVTKRSLVLWYFNLDVEGCLQVWLVEAGERAAGIARLELRAEHVVELVVFGNGCWDFAFGRVLGSIEACHDLQALLAFSLASFKVLSNVRC